MQEAHWSCSWRGVRSPLGGARSAILRGEPGRGLRVAACLLWLLPAVSAFGQFAPAPKHREAYGATLGAKLAPKSNADSSTLVQVVHVPGAPWLRLHVGSYHLGPDSFLTFTSLEDGGRQRLDAKTLPQWYDTTAMFNGDAVEVELHLAAGEEGVFATIDELTVGERVGAAENAADEGGPVAEPETLCGGDSRVASNDGRVGRISGCTAWLISNGGVLTAGHCADSDPDKDGPLLPDGVLDLSGLMSFNVPLSDSDGTLNASVPEDQYPIDTSDVVWRFDGEGQGLGKDWAVFGLNPNSTTQERAHIAQGFFRMTRENPAFRILPPDFDIIRITGYGKDDTPTGTGGGRNSRNRTNQTSTGLYLGESSSGSNRWHKYSVDTEPANSGSPVIWNTDSSTGNLIGFTIGIHTNGGCGADSGSNKGTSFEVNALEIAIRDFPGSNTVYADSISGHPAPSEDGSVFRPFNTVTEAINAVANNGRISIVKGNYRQSAGNTFSAGADGKAFTLTAPVGDVTIGN